MAVQTLRQNRLPSVGVAQQAQSQPKAVEQQGWGMGGGVVLHDTPAALSAQVLLGNSPRAVFATIRSAARK